MLQVNGEWVYEDLTPENTVELLENLKKGTDKKGPQIDRNDCEGPMGRTSLKVCDMIFQGMNLTEEIRYERDFAKAKQDWEEAERKKKEQQQRKAQEAKRIE